MPLARCSFQGCHRTDLTHTVLMNRILWPLCAEHAQPEYHPPTVIEDGLIQPKAVPA